MKMTWILTIDNKGFKSKMLVEGTEQEMQAYMESEIGYIPAYTGATEDEVKAAKMLGMKIYICPTID